MTQEDKVRVKSWIFNHWCVPPYRRCPFSTLLVQNTRIIQYYCFDHSFLTAVYHNSVFLCLFVSSLLIFFLTFLACSLNFSYNLSMAGGSQNQYQMQQSIPFHCITIEVLMSMVTSHLLHHCTVFIYFSELLKLSCTSCRWKPYLFYVLEWIVLFHYEFPICKSILSYFGTGQRLF